MKPHTVKVPVTAPVCVECDFWREEDGWFGRCPDTCITVHGSGFEDGRCGLEFLDLRQTQRDAIQAACNKLRKTGTQM